jgi:hypothetical protein
MCIIYIVIFSISAIIKDKNDPFTHRERKRKFEKTFKNISPLKLLKVNISHYKGSRQSC